MYLYLFIHFSLLQRVGWLYILEPSFIEFCVRLTTVVLVLIICYECNFIQLIDKKVKIKLTDMLVDRESK